MKDDDIEVLPLRQRPIGGQQAGMFLPGVLVLHKPTGIAVACEDERSQIKCRAEATRKLRGVLSVIEASIEMRRVESADVPGESIAELEANVPAAQRRSMIALTRWRGVMDEFLALDANGAISARDGEGRP